MSNLRIILIGALALLLSHYVAYWYGAQKPAQVQTVEKEVVHTNVVTKVREIVNPDGSKQIDTIITDKSKVDSTNTAKATTAPLPLNWLVGASYNLNSSYSADISRRILGPIFVGVGASTAGVVSLSVKLEF